MNREFLQNFQVSGQGLPKEIIDAIMEENGRDIEGAKKPYADYDAIKQQLQTARDGLKAFEGVNVADLQEQIATLQKNLNDQETAYKQQLADMEFDTLLDGEITKAKGKNAKAIRAILDVDALKQSKDRAKDIAAALETAKKDNDYLFTVEQTPPPYAPGAGNNPANLTLSPELNAFRMAAGLPQK